MATAAITLPKSIKRRPRNDRAAGRAVFPEFYFVKHIDNSRLLREVDVERRIEHLSVAGFLVLVFLFVFMFAWQHFQCVRHGYEIEQAKQEYAALEEQNHRLRVEQAALADPQRIDTLARTRLGMITPTPEQIVRVGGLPSASEENPELAHNFSVGSGDTSHEP